MNRPGVYMCPLSWISLPTPSPSHPSRSSQCTSPEHSVSCIEPRLVIYFIYGNIHVSMLVSQIILPSPSPTESKSLLIYMCLFCCLAYRVIGEGNGNLFQYSCLENPMNEGAWLAAVHGASKSFGTRLSDLTFTFHFHALEKEMSTHSRVLAWRIPWTTEPGGMPSRGSHRVGHDWSNLTAAYRVIIIIFLNSIYALTHSIGVLLSDLLHSV